MANKTQQKKLFQIIKDFGTNPPGFALLLGAGASITSGVKSAAQMIEEWREKHYQLSHAEGDTKDDHLGKQTWYNKPNEYGKLFEAVYALPAHRREYIESCIVNASPSWGYTYLAHLLGRNYFNTIVTTNFDDLVSDVCYKFPSVSRPMVCAHDSDIDSIRLLASRPKIIKLHGDFLFDDIKNTPQETDRLEENTRDKIRQFADQYGLIVIGYGGKDASVMDVLKDLLRDERHFKNGVYWCSLDGHISDKAEDLSYSKLFYTVQIEGFDQFMAELSDFLQLGLPKELAEPYVALGDSLQKLLAEVEQTDGKKLHTIERDRKSVLKALQKIPPQIVPAKFDFEKISGFQFQVGNIAVRQLIPFGDIGKAHETAGNTEEALKFLTLQIKHEPNPRAFAYVFDLLKRHNMDDTKYDFFAEMLRSSRRMFEEECATGNNLSISLMNLKRWRDAKWVLDTAEESFRKAGDTNPEVAGFFKLNKMQIKVHTGHGLTQRDQTELKHLLNSESPYVRLGATILLRRWSEAESHLEKCLALGALKKGITDWPMLALLKPHLQKSTVLKKLRRTA